MSRSLTVLFLIAIVFSACSGGNVTSDSSLQRYFDSVHLKGTFALFDNGQGHFTIYNLPRYKDSAYLPGATFDIVEALVGIQTGVMKDDSALTSAFREKGDSNTLAFRNLAARIGRDTLQKWVDSLHYGNKLLSRDSLGRPSSDKLLITSDEQLGLTKKLYFDQLPFYKRPQQLVRKMMNAETNSNYDLRYKTGQTTSDGKTIGWAAGWVEENKHVFFFIVNVEGTDPGADLGAAGLKIARGILTEWGFFQGKK